MTSSFERPPKLLLPPMQQREEIPSLRNLNLPTPVVSNYHLPPMPLSDHNNTSPYRRLSFQNTLHYYPPPMDKYPSFPPPLKMQSPQTLSPLAHLPQTPSADSVRGPAHLPSPYPAQPMSANRSLSYHTPLSQPPKDRGSPPSEANKRKRRKAHEVVRLYKCNHESCQKAYGTLNHLNSHIVLQKHGQKRSPSEFKELREELKRKRKLEKASSRLNEREKQQNVIYSQIQNDHDHERARDGQSHKTSAPKDRYYVLNMLPPLHRPKYSPLHDQPRLY
ncbi:uncharacterized protein OGAPODRAFT_6914 [Ogataea polymorpha]|uniref:uncharacterized protein n=1 Tax=Ogataea polymorpha TaxID=460523 RepID=UPI0007F45986|nr:uncharacterized protein OGAPODRAFT_6914 [Ogataea polymorpha]OBA17415.1 hypothetical protein OGAPODRAFT_6914 [Ogataea polymorpha]